MKQKKTPVSENPPTKEEVEAYAIECGVPASVGAAAWQYYTVMEWHDMNDNIIYRWKGKVLLNQINRYKDEQDGTSKRSGKPDTSTTVLSRKLSELSAARRSH